MKYFALFLLTLICSAPLSAQTSPLTPVAVPTPYAETPELWQKFAPQLEDFTLEVPGNISQGFASSNTPLPSDSGASSPVVPPSPAPIPDPPKNRQYMTLVNGDLYYIYSDPVSAPHFNRTIYLFAESQAPGIEPNEIYAFIDAFGYYHQILIVKSGDRVYTFQTVSATKDNPSVNRFFREIKIKDTKLQPKKREALQNIAIENFQRSINCNPVSAFTPKPDEKAIGNGIGSNTPNAAVSADQTSVPATPIKIVSKPRANYTDYARFYHITGSVQLRVTFMADGKVGLVSPVKRVPFGLTEQAIIAACNLKFEPATKNGVPYTVTKQVIYNFTLY